MKFGSLFTGVGGFDVALEGLEQECVWQSEINKHSRSVLSRHWPAVTQLGDIRYARDVEPVDLICGGFPCQDLSTAGKRIGLDGARSGLFYEFARLIGEVRPRWVVLENVPGLLSSNGGRDMGSVLGTLAGLGYGYAYRVLDAQFFGVPQRRRRVFIVGHSGGRSPVEVFGEPEGGGWHPAPRREARQDPAGTAPRGAGRAGRRDIIAAQCCGGSVVPPPGPLRARMGCEGDGVPFFVPVCVTGQVTHTLCAEGADASEDGTGRGIPVIAVIQDGFSTLEKAQGGVGVRRDGPMYTLDTRGYHAVAYQAAGAVQPPLYYTHDYNQDRVYGIVGPSPALTATATRNFWEGQVVRRLTPRECERLQGFPDDWTRWGADNREISDSSRYRMMGNAVAVPVIDWLMRRLIAADAAIEGRDTRQEEAA